MGSRSTDSIKPAQRSCKCPANSIYINIKKIIWLYRLLSVCAFLRFPNRQYYCCVSLDTRNKSTFERQTGK